MLSKSTCSNWNESYRGSRITDFFVFNASWGFHDLCVYKTTNCWSGQCFVNTLGRSYSILLISDKYFGTGSSSVLLAHACILSSFILPLNMYIFYCKQNFKLKKIKSAGYYRPPGGARLFDMKVVSSHVFLRTYYV